MNNLLKKDLTKFLKDIIFYKELPIYNINPQNLIQRAEELEVRLKEEKNYE